MDLIKNILTNKGSVEGFAPPTTEEIGRILAMQGTILNGIGMAVINEASSLEGAKRNRKLAEGAKFLTASKATLVEASRILEKYELPPQALTEARESLIKVAIENGYEIAFEVDGKVHLERVVRGSIRETVDCE